MYSHLPNGKYEGQRYIEDPSLYAIPAPRALGAGLLCLCKKFTWVTGSLVHMMFTPINKVAAGNLLSDPTFVNVLCSSTAGASLLRVTDSGDIAGVQQTIGFLLHNTENKMKKTAVHGTYGTHKNVLRSVDCIPESIEEALTKEKEVFFKKMDASYTDSKYDGTVRFESCIHESVEKPLSRRKTCNKRSALDTNAKCVTDNNATCFNSCNQEYVAEGLSKTYGFKNCNAISYDNCMLQALEKGHVCNDKNTILPNISSTHRTAYNDAGYDCCVQESVAEVLKKTRGYYKEPVASCIDDTCQSDANVASSEVLEKKNESDDTEFIIREINGTYVAEYIVSSSGAGKEDSAAKKQVSGINNNETNASNINTPHTASVNTKSNEASCQSYPDISSTPVTVSKPYHGLPKIDRVFSLAADTGLNHSTQSKQFAHVHRPEDIVNVKRADISCSKEQTPVQKSTMAQYHIGSKNPPCINERLKLKLRWNKRWEIEKPGCNVMTSKVNETTKTTQLLSVAMRRQLTDPYTISSQRNQTEDMVVLSGVSGEDIGVLNPRLSTFGSTRIVTMKNKVPWIRIHKLGTDGTRRVPFKQLHSI